MAILKSKITSLMILLLIILFSSLPALSRVSEEAGQSLTIGYVVVIMTTISTAFTIAITYLLNLIFLKFFANKPLKNKMIIFNFIILSIVINVFVVYLLGLFFNSNLMWLVIFNPLYFFCQYLFFEYLTKEEKMETKKALYYLMICFAFTVIGQVIM